MTSAALVFTVAAVHAPTNGRALKAEPTRASIGSVRERTSSTSLGRYRDTLQAEQLGYLALRPGVTTTKRPLKLSVARGLARGGEAPSCSMVKLTPPTPIQASSRQAWHVPWAALS